MRVSELIKATVACGGVAYLVFICPVLSQIAIIGLLFFLWLGCATQAISAVRRKHDA